MIPIAAGLTILVLTLAVRALTVNRLVRRKLRLATTLAVAGLAVAAAARLAPLAGDVTAQLRSVELLVLALAGLDLAVIVALNPLRADRVPDHFPSIVQDAIVVGLFLIVGTAVMREKFLTTSAVGAVVVGFALQDTLGNAFAGLAIQTEKPFLPGQWIQVGQLEGRVTEITWRATKLRTKAGSFVIVPNNVMSREPIVNFSEPILPVRLQVEVGATYHKAPNEVKAAIFEALANAPLVLREPPPDVLLLDFASSAITYRARFWVEDYADDDRARDQVRSGIYYSFRRHGIEIPWPIQVEYQREDLPARPAGLTAELAAALGRAEIFASLSEEERSELAASSEERLYAQGEAVVREGEPGASMFVVRSGRVEITVEPGRRRVALTEAGGYFGEMSLLTGAPRTATVWAATDCALVELTSHGFARFVSSKPEVLERVGLAVMERRAQLERARAVEAPAAAEAPPTFLARVRRFLGLPG